MQCQHVVALHVVLLAVTTQCASRSVPVYDTKGFLADRLTQEDRARLHDCPCSDKLIKSTSLCLPVDFTGKKTRKEVFAFSVATDDRWKHYDWDQLTTVAWNEDKELLCHAHSKGVRVVVKHNFDDVNQLCNVSARQEWIKTTYNRIVKNYADGVNIDTEKPMHGTKSQCLASLVRELRHGLDQHALTQNAQITFDIPWAPRGVDGRYYPWRELAAAADFLIVMSYDMRSQVYDACVAGANSPLALVKQGLQEFLFAYDIMPSKLVLGVPWYGYHYPCLQGQQVGPAIVDTSRCQIRPVPFFGAPCSDAAGGQIDYGDIRRLVKGHSLVEQWDPTTLTPFVWFSPPEGGRSQIWFDNPRSLRAKYALVRKLQLRGVGMWNADTLDYAAVNDSHIMWRSLAKAFDP
ncbi:Di-N-acetylchitobiase, putative [Phytophthora infestans T30-4]|uniref:Di-N-acetylchitobiase, putative n=2 Tax=Phytophthora infestans TaxID=4787 RepID=D0NUW1_PHYIT|nr:Di-N-acetylchitobiase, putative [Phytophthora infestans T30-4]EEY65484.1 Di-N-acetylchitobiase, putative [Phytophthora infestans T30-4]KAF4045777.1 Glycosyl hydrolases family 18 [Phytophthora infestans]KAF4148183.1 Glycosyl hydrolases family 18 [Phytophthora infestans]KAI9994064.1 hypothetical protein PInf_016627 [Phytophthora infestans]|eukprot:XP_002897113.1 Di-N-acetylchitobiase, putative [Phytophthora infestans T30-4]